MKEGTVSVIMSVYNCQTTIKSAIDSIIGQTYTNWEMIICDDCSTDLTFTIIKKYEFQYPGKIIIIHNDENMKLSYSLNRCLELAQGEYVARMDGDDISMPNRFELQVEYLKTHNNMELVGSAMQRFNDEGNADIVYPIENPNIYTLHNQIPFCHATIMTYKYVYEAVGGYTVSKRTIRAQDYDLWFKFYSKSFSGNNIMKPLYMVREDINAIKRRSLKNRIYTFQTTLIGYKLLNYPIIWYSSAYYRLLINIIKGLIPSYIVLMYRNFQKKKYYNNNKS